MTSASPDPEAPQIGVLALQGAFAAHAAMLERCGVAHREVRTPDELAEVDALIIPGGESTAIRKQLVRSHMHELVRSRVRSGMPMLGTCAGLIVLAHAAPDGAPECYGMLDVDVSRNAFGRQVHSGVRTVVRELDGATGDGMFIRAPRITRVGDQVRVLARLDRDDDDGAGEPVAVQQGSIIGATFHPELGDDAWLHELLVGLACRERRVKLGREATGEDQS